MPRVLSSGSLIALAALARLAPLAALSCSAELDAPADVVDRARTPIAYGTADTTHPAVMALINTTGGACSGTVIAKNPPWGYLLTAAHCVVARDSGGNIITPVMNVPPTNLLVIPGNDYQMGATTSTFYPVESFNRHTGYNGQTTNPNDIAVVRFYGADASTPTIPRISAVEDDITNGTPLRYVGFGQTQSNSMNSVRFTVVRPAINLTSQFISHSKSSGGTCQGDSGGPALHTVGAGERVAGVNSFSAAFSCGSMSGTGTAVRVSNQISFIDGFVNQTPPALTCAVCRSFAGTTFGVCDTELATCATGTECGDFLACVDPCGPSDTACVQACQTMHRQGLIDYRQLIRCGCENQCATECGADPACDLGCGFAYPTPACDACVEANCCAESSACADDVECVDCATNAMAPASCAMNQLEHASRVCNLTECGSECGNACGFSNPPPCGDCITSCCTESVACAKDLQCWACATGQATAGACTGLQLFDDFFGCLGACPNDPCMAAAGAGGMGGMAGAGDGGPAGAAGDPGVGGTAGSGAEAGAGIGANPGTDGGAATSGFGGFGGSLPATGGASNTPPSDSGDSGGCGCRAAGSEGSTAPWSILVALAFASRVRRRGDGA